MAEEVAELVDQGRVVAYFDGRMEYGPRALGSRSILCSGRDPHINVTLNERLFRTEFMPFAPVTLWRNGRPATGTSRVQPTQRNS